MTEDELRARLLAEAEVIIHELLAKKPVDAKITLSDIEELVLRTGQQVQAKVLKALVEANGVDEGKEIPWCEACGRTMQRRGTRPRQVVTAVGAVKLRRAYYVCAECGASLFPPG
jgi:hypothetical protein